MGFERAPATFPMAASEGSDSDEPSWDADGRDFTLGESGDEPQLTPEAQLERLNALTSALNAEAITAERAAAAATAYTELAAKSATRKPPAAQAPAAPAAPAPAAPAPTSPVPASKQRPPESAAPALPLRPAMLAKAMNGLLRCPLDRHTALPPPHHHATTPPTPHHRHPPRSGKEHALELSDDGLTIDATTTILERELRGGELTGNIVRLVLGGTDLLALYPPNMMLAETPEAIAVPSGPLLVIFSTAAAAAAAAAVAAVAAVTPGAAGPAAPRTRSSVGPSVIGPSIRYDYEHSTGRSDASTHLLAMEAHGHAEGSLGVAPSPSTSRSVSRSVEPSQLASLSNADHVLVGCNHACNHDLRAALDGALGVLEVGTYG